MNEINVINVIWYTVGAKSEGDLHFLPQYTHGLYLNKTVFSLCTLHPQVQTNILLIIYYF